MRNKNMKNKKNVTAVENLLEGEYVKLAEVCMDYIDNDAALENLLQDYLANFDAWGLEASQLLDDHEFLQNKTVNSETLAKHLIQNITKQLSELSSCLEERKNKNLIHDFVDQLIQNIEEEKLYRKEEEEERIREEEEEKLALEEEKQEQEIYEAECRKQEKEEAEKKKVLNRDLAALSKTLTEHQKQEIERLLGASL